MTRLRWTPLLILAAACTAPGSTGNWWDTPSGDSTETPATDDDDGGAGDDDDDDDDDDGPESGTEAWWWGEGDGSSSGFTGEGGFLALRFEGKNEVEECVIDWTWETVSTADCSQCDVAWTLRRTNVTVNTDGAACAQVGDVASLEGSTVGVGGSGENMYVDEGSGWVEAGYFEQEGGAVAFERFFDDEGGEDGDDDDDEGGDKGEEEE